MNRRAMEADTHPYGRAVGNLIDQFATLPGIGRKSAERLAHFVLNSSDSEAMKLAEAIREVKQTVRPCTRCFNLTENDLCTICSDVRRQQDLLCIVEQPRDVRTIEASGAFPGLYHILQGKISPLEGIGPEDLTLDALVRRVRHEAIKEIVMATNPTLEGDGTALYISNLLEGEDLKITRLARGIASGSVLEFANKEMLADALKGRQEF